jgi:SAM-dependent methyltransferase
MNDIDLLVDLHRRGRRQGPGGDDETRRAIDLAGLRETRNLRIADIGCGTGAATLVLARDLDAHVTAVDFLPQFLDDLAEAAERAGLSARIDRVEASMEALPFEDGQFDAIWSEGAIYNMGFASGVHAWRRFLKPGGILAVSELTWLTASRPADLEAHWSAEYPEVDTASAKMKVLEDSGYSPLGYFPLPRHCWTDNYYGPLRARLGDFVARHADSPSATVLAEAEEREIALYERNAAFVSYGFYIAQRVDG